MGAWFLLAKLVARKTEYRETSIFVVFMKSTQTCVLRGKASSTRDVDDETNLVNELSKWDLFTRNREHVELMELGHAVW